MNFNLWLTTKWSTFSDEPTFFCKSVVYCQFMQKDTVTTNQLYQSNIMQDKCKMKFLQGISFWLLAQTHFKTTLLVLCYESLASRYLWLKGQKSFCLVFCFWSKVSFNIRKVFVQIYYDLNSLDICLEVWCYKVDVYDHNCLFFWNTFYISCKCYLY